MPIVCGSFQSSNTQFPVTCTSTQFIKMKFLILPLYCFLILVTHNKASSQEQTEVEDIHLDASQVQALKDEVYKRVVSPEDSPVKAEVKSHLVNYLVETTISDYLEKNRAARQDEDGSDAAEGGEGQGGDQVFNGVRRILQNVFTGNLVGVIQESVGIRAPTRVQDFFSDVMGALFGSAAVKGAGTHGLPQPQNATANCTVPGAAPAVNQVSGVPGQQLPPCPVGAAGVQGGTPGVGVVANNAVYPSAANVNTANGYPAPAVSNTNSNGDSEDDEGNDDLW